MSTLVLDAGALIALERNDRAMWAVLKLAALRTDAVIVPSTVVAQVWRGSRRQASLARALDQCSIAGIDDMAREVGELCGRTKTADICDAHVALVAMRCDVLYTADPVDLRRLTSACDGRPPVIVRC